MNFCKNFHFACKFALFCVKLSLKQLRIGKKEARKA